ncbi:hypothetical protein H4O14_01545 [Bacillus sp. PAMC26568]|nr:hypothetical protein H4O14_01545 [Bacillus sp. PAMC26568]
MKKKVLPITIALAVGFCIGSISTIKTEANTNPILASVDWVLSKINPLEQRLTNLENQVKNLSDGSGGNENPDEPIRDQSSVTVTASSPVKKGAADHYETIFTAPQNTVLVYYDTFTNSVTNEKWYLVRLSDSKVGAIKAAKTQLSITPYQGTYSKVAIRQNTPIRKGADVSYPAFYTAGAGAVLTYQSTFTNSITGQKWHIVKLNDGKAGAVLATHTEVMK